LVLSALAIAGPASTALAGDAPASGAQTAKAEPGRQDSLKLAREALAAAQDGSRDAATVSALCEAAHDLAAAAPQGLDVAVEAMELLAQRAPKRAVECTRRIVTIRRRQYAAAAAAERPAAGERLAEALEGVAEAFVEQGNYADAISYLRQALSVAAGVKSARQKEVRARIDRLVALERIHRVVGDLKARLKRSPEDAYARRRLIDLYLVELDDPAAAAALLRQDADEVLRTYLPLATKDPAELKPEACLELGNWYYSLKAKAVTAVGKSAMLLRAKGYLETYVEKADANDPNAAKAKLTLEKIEQELESLAPQGAAGRWIDVLRLVDPARHSVEGRWVRQGSKLGTAATGADRVVIPVAPKGDYELSAQFVRLKGDGDVNLILPVGGASVVLALSEHQAAANGLSKVNGNFHRDEKASAAKGLTNRTAHKVHVKVTVKDDSARIRATLDGKKLLEWSGPQSALAVADEWRLPNATVLGLGTYTGCTTTFSSAQLRMLTGKPVAVKIAVRDPDEQRRSDLWRDALNRWRRSAGRSFGRGRGGRRR
jgi:tetratricopeptide (TPR) repeat protein